VHGYRLARESNLPKWRELLIGFRRLEDRGEVRGGRFANGFLGEQFASAEAVEAVPRDAGVISTDVALLCDALRQIGGDYATARAMGEAAASVRSTL